MVLGYIGGAICAERAALMRLRHLNSPVIKKVIVTTDSINAIAPGVLCREYLMSSADPNTVIVMGNCDSSIVRETTLSYLFPFPYLYRYWHRKSVISNANIFSNQIKTRIKDYGNVHVETLFDEAMKCNKNDKFDSLHPVRFSAAVMFSDGTVRTAWQMKGLEYGCTIDPVTQLIRDMEFYRISTEDEHSEDNGVLVDYLLMIDQWGICHAPFAQARGLLNEHGFKYVKCVIHDDLGDVHIVPVSSLVPFGETADSLSHTDFN